MYNNLVNTIGFLKDFDPEVSEAMNDELKRHVEKSRRTAAKW